MRVYDQALSLYLSCDGSPRGCLVIGTAVSEAVANSKVRQSPASGLRAFDSAFVPRLRTALEKGELHRDADSAVLATATMHTIAIRAGVPRAELRTLARKAVKLICR